MNAKEQRNTVAVLQLTLHDTLIGYLAGYSNGRNVLQFADTFKNEPRRPTFSLITHPDFPRANQLMAQPWVTRQRLHPTLSNLLPEGVLRELIAQGLKTHIDNEFEIFSHLGHDLPGAIIAAPLKPADIPDGLVADHGRVEVVPFPEDDRQNTFSLAGVQMKFSMQEKDGRYNLSKKGNLGDWIIKTPSTMHRDVPINEYTAMSLAAAAGVQIPEIRLIEVGKVDNLSQINLPDEKFAFAIKRFDREPSPNTLGTRIHMEDFAQILVKYPHEKYNTANYEQIGKVIYQYSGDGLADTQQFARRLLVNILLANGDAHLKNWSLLYRDQITPRLSPAYDIVTTSVYIDGERKYALNLGKTKEWHKVTLKNFEVWATKSGIPWRAVVPHLANTLERARDIWPALLNDLPMNDNHKELLKNHWRNLQKDFRILVGVRPRGRKGT